MSSASDPPSGDASNVPTSESTGVRPNTPTGPDFADAETLLPAIAQEATSGEILMMAYMNQEAYEATLEKGEAVYYSRSRKRLWHKGEESGHVQVIRQICVDCDRDTILLRVEQRGPGACHEGYPTCFFREVTPDGLRIIQEKAFDTSQTYGDV